MIFNMINFNNVKVKVLITERFLAFQRYIKFVTRL